MKITLGPGAKVLLAWRNSVFAFYQAMAERPWTSIYLGETVCSRSHELRLSTGWTWPGMLREGKQVVMSSHGAARIDQRTWPGCTSWRQRRVLTVEANDMGAVHCLAGKPLCFVAGPHLNLFNPSPAWMAQPAPALGDAAGNAPPATWPWCRPPPGLQTEVFAYGPLPLAYSARCFTARHYNLPKDDCRFSCMEHPDGLLLQKHARRKAFWCSTAPNAVGPRHNLLAELPQMQALGVDILRISPQPQHMAQDIDCLV